MENVSDYYLYSKNLGFKFQADPVSWNFFSSREPTFKYLESVMKVMASCILAKHKEDTEM